MHSSGCVFALEVPADLLDHRRFFDAGDILNVTGAVVAGLDVDYHGAKLVGTKPPIVVPHSHVRFY